jgi:hypothetical protein
MAAEGNGGGGGGGGGGGMIGGRGFVKLRFKVYICVLHTENQTARQTYTGK